MDFNASKCNLLPIDNKRNPTMYEYNINSQPLFSVQTHGYLGARYAHDRRWGTAPLESLETSRPAAKLQKNVGRTTKEWRKWRFLFCRIPVVLESRSSSQGGGGASPARTPWIAPAASGTPIQMLLLT